MKRLKKRFEKDGDQGLVHRGRGNPEKWWERQ